jgi:uncharacterized membrane protein HdeD (DUF308 family)
MKHIFLRRDNMKKRKHEQVLPMLVVLAMMIFAGLPSAAAWAVGLLVGINMIFGGTALIAMALHARKSA